MSTNRVSIREIPNWTTECKVKARCVYRDEFGSCDEPRTNKGNSDAACHNMNNRDLLKILEGEQ